MKKTAFVVLIVASLTVASCMSAKTYRRVDAPRYPPTRAADVQVLYAMPKGAVELGEVEGRGGGWGMVFTPDELSNARDGAAEMGAEAIVVEGTGTEPAEGDPFFRDLPTVRAKAIRFRP